MNSVNLVGRLTKDPEVSYTATGVAVCRFTLAINRPFTNAQGEREADFIQCTTWRTQAENLANFQVKGNLISVIGRIETGSFENAEGAKVFTTTVVAESIGFLEKKDDDSNNNNQFNNKNNNRNTQRKDNNYNNKRAQGR